MKKQLKYVGLLILLMGIVFLYGFSSQRNGRIKVKKVAIEFQEGANGFLTHQLVDKMLIQNRKSIKNQAKRVIDLQSLEQNVLKNPFVEKATVFLTVDGRLQTRIKQREPIARISTNSAVYYVDKYGVKVPISKNYSARVPLISGVKTTKEIAQIIRLLQVILNDGFLKKEIIGIRKTNKNEFVFDVRSGNYKIIFGKMENVATKFKKLKAFYNNTFQNKTIKKYSIINLKYHNQVVCTK